MKLTRVFNYGLGPWEKLHIEDAQLRESMAGSLMDEVRRCGSPWATLDGDVLTIWDDFGHHYIYRVVGYDAERDLYELEWPD